MQFTIRRGIVLTAATAAFALAGAACGSDSSSSSSGSSSGGAASSSAASDKPSATIDSLKGVATSVDVDPATAGVLQQNGVTVAPVGPATASMAAGKLTVSFPITGGHVAIYPQTALPFIRGTVTHSGGLTFAAGAKTLTATDFIVDPGASTLTATVGGSQVKLLDLNGSGVMVTKDAQGMVHLDGTIAVLSQDAADAMNKTFGVTLFKQGIPLGVAHIVAAG